MGCIFITIANIFALYPAEFVREAFDKVLQNINNKDLTATKKVLLIYGGLIFLFAVLKGIFMYLMRQTIIVMSRKIEYDLKNEVYQKYQTLSLSFYKKHATGDLMNRISEDISRVRMYLGPCLMYAINITILFTLVIQRMISISNYLTAYVILPLPLLAISVYFVSNNINRRSEKVQAQLSEITTISQESFSGIKIIKSFNNQKDIINNFINNCKKYTKRQLQLVKIEALFFPLIITMIGCSTILTIYIGGLESLKGNITTGNIAEFIIYINMLAWPIASIGWVTSLIQRAAASQERINNFLFLKPDIKNNQAKNTTINGDIVFQNVCFKYPDNNIQALTNINFSIKSGDKIGIFGKTGSGKSTLVNLICRFYNINYGEITINNTPIQELNLYNLRKSIGYIAQDTYLFSGTIAENITFSSNQIDEKRMTQAAKQAGILEEIKNFKNGFNTIIGERGVQLSGGQRQRISIARTLYTNPDIYIFDDCLSAVDINKEKKILKNIIEEIKNKTAIIISHRISSFKEMDKIIVLEYGKITEFGNHKKLIKNNSFYSKMFKLQNQNDKILD